MTIDRVLTRCVLIACGLLVIFIYVSWFTVFMEINRAAFADNETELLFYNQSECTNAPLILEHDIVQTCQQSVRICSRSNNVTCIFLQPYEFVALCKEYRV